MGDPKMGRPGKWRAWSTPVVPGWFNFLTMDMGMGQNETARGQVLVLGSIWQGNPFWVHPFDPQPYRYISGGTSPPHLHLPCRDLDPMFEIGMSHWRCLFLFFRPHV